MTAGTARCPRCGDKVSLEAAHWPFCSQRCRLIDLDRWLGGEYRIRGRKVSETEIKSESEE